MYEFDERYHALEFFLALEKLRLGEDGGGDAGPDSSEDTAEDLQVQSAPKLPSGSILDDPELLMCEDTWDDAREEEALEAIERQGSVMEQRLVQRYEARQSNYWDMFYRRNEDRFFKDRHYLHKDFPELQEGSAMLGGSVGHGGPGVEDAACHVCKAGEAHPRPSHAVLIEVGCGVGNAIFPLLELHPHLFVYGLDFSARAIELLKEHPLYVSTARCQGFVCDVVNDPLPPTIAEHGGADLCVLMYALSAMSPERMPDIAHKLFSVLKPGGRVLLRDYGRYDQAQLRFKRGQRLGQNFYLRWDGTRAYYFSTHDLRHVFVEQAGFEEVELGYIMRQYVNREQKVVRRRIWIHARFQKPLVVLK